MNPVAAKFVLALAQVLTIAIVARSLMSWFPGAAANPIGKFVIEITEPLLAPLRRVIPSLGMMDISPIVAIVILQVIASVISRLV